MARSTRWFKWGSLGLAGLGLLTATALYAQSDQTGILNGIASSYKIASEGWLARLTPIAQRLFVVLAGIEFAISGLIYGIRRDALDEVAAKFVLKFALTAGLLTLVTSYSFWLPPIISGFATAGETAIGVNGTIGPSDVVDFGTYISGVMLLSFEGFGTLSNVAAGLVGAAEALIVLVAYIIIAASLVIALVESYVVLTAGVVFMGFAAFRATAWISEGMLSYGLSVAIKIFLLYLLVGVGMDMSNTWLFQLQYVSGTGVDGAGARMLGEVFGGAVIFAILVVRVPDRVAERITGHASFGITSALRAL
jgi:type IV secretion system protein TrbL